MQRHGRRPLRLGLMVFLLRATCAGQACPSTLTFLGPGGAANWSYTVASVGASPNGASPVSMTQGPLQLTPGAYNQINTAAGLPSGIGITYDIYRTIVPPGGTPSTVGKIAPNVPSPSSFEDTGLPGDGTQPPFVPALASTRQIFCKCSRPWRHRSQRCRSPGPCWLGS